MAVNGGGAPPALVALRALGLGDLLTAVPALRALARAFPAHRRLLAAPRWLWPLVELVGPDPERVPEHRERAVTALADVDGLVRRLPPAAGCASLAVNLHGRGPQSHRLLLAARPGRLIAFRHPEVLESAGGPEWNAWEHEVARWCRLLGAYGIAADPCELDLPAPPPSPIAAAVPRGATIVHPGAASPARRWPAERWAAVARHERARGATVIVTGSAAEARLARQVAQEAGLPHRSVAAGRTGLRELAALIAGAARVVCGDTGVAHLATALGTPSVVVFGPTPPARWGPPPERPWHRALWAGHSGDPHGDHPDPGLLEIEPADVLAALEELAPRPRAGGRARADGRMDVGAEARAAAL